MAEVFGAVASGLALAEFAVQLKTLLSHISDAPRKWKSLVSQVESYVGILNALDWNDELDTEISPSLRSSLHAAALQCHDAVEKLSLIVKDLSALGNPSSRRRTIAAIRFVRQEDTILRFEQQLQTAVQQLQTAVLYLIFAHQRCMSYVNFSIACAQILTVSQSSWHKTQLPDVIADVIVPRLLKQMSLAPKPTMAIGNNITAPVMNAWPEPVFTRDDLLRRLDFLFPSNPLVFEAFTQHNSPVLQASLRDNNNMFIEDSSHYDDAYNLLRTNDREKIEQALMRRQFTIHDRFLVDGHAHSFAEVSQSSCIMRTSLTNFCASSLWRPVPGNHSTIFWKKLHNH